MKNASRIKNVLLFPLVCLATAIAPLSASAADKLSVRLDLYPWGIHAAMHLAQQKKWFQDAGLDVDIQDGTGSINTMQLVGAGRVDVGQVQLGLLGFAKESGMTLTSFAGFARRGDLAVIVDKKSSIEKAADLKGKKLVTFASSPWAPFVKPFLKAAGIEGQTNVVMVAPTAMVSTYATGDADGFMTLAPFGVPLVANERPSKAVLLSDTGIDFPSYGLVATPEVLKAKRPLLQKLAKIQVDAWNYIYNGHIDEAAQAIINARADLKLDKKMLVEQIELYRPFFDTANTKGVPFGIQTDADWASAITSMENAGIMKKGYKPSDFYTNALLSN